MLGALLVFGEIACLSVARYGGYNAGMNDLGKMSQAVWSATQGQPLTVTTHHGPMSRLSWHVELIYFLLAPVYALLPSPITLLIIQAALFVAAAFPLYSLSLRNLENHIVSLVIVAVYLLYPGAQAAVLFDFHGDTLAMPLLIFALHALDRKAYRQYAFWVVLALSCKFYVAIPVTALGGMLWLQNKREVGLFTLLGGLLWGGITYFLIRPLFSSGAASGSQGGAIWDYFTFYFGQLFISLKTTWLARSVTALIVLLPVMWPLYHAPAWWIPTLSIGLPALLSSGPGPSYYFGYHHYALVVPFAVVGCMYGIKQMRHRVTTLDRSARSFTLWPVTLGVTLIFTVLFNGFFLDTPLSLEFWNPSNGALVDTMRYAYTSRDRMKDVWLSTYVPAQEPLAASNFIAPHIANRSTVYVTDYFLDYVDEVDYVIVDALFDYVRILGTGEVQGGITRDWEALAWSLHDSDFGLVAARDGLLLFERGAVSEQVMKTHVESIPVPPSQLLTEFENRVGLVDSEVRAVAPGGYLLRLDWVALRPLHEVPQLVAVSRLKGVANARIVHIPTTVLLPTHEWREGQIVQEEFEFEIPVDVQPGDYPLLVGWYDSSNVHAFATDERSRVGQEFEVGVLEVR